MVLMRAWVDGQAHVAQTGTALRRHGKALTALALDPVAMPQSEGLGLDYVAELTALFLLLDFPLEGLQNMIVFQRSSTRCSTRFYSTCA